MLATKSPPQRPQPLFRRPPAYGLVVRSPEQHPFSAQRKAHRAACALIAIALVFGVVGARYFWMQILRHGAYVLQADDNRFRPLTIPAPRGTIYDRKGEVIAETVMEYDLYLEPGPPERLSAQLASAVARVPELRVDSVLAPEKVLATGEQVDDPVPVARRLSFAQVSWIEEHRSDLPGVLVEPRPVRRYPGGPSVAHLVGYVGQIGSQEMRDTAWAGYEPGRVIGRSGIERHYERRLGGRPGARYVEVDARGRTVGGFADQLTLQPTPGEDLKLTVDLALQRFIHETWPAGRRGAVVALAPETGEVLALYSSPTYDPNGLLPGANPSLWDRVWVDPGRPLINRATQGRYAPASTWKLATAIVGLERGVIRPADRMPISCTGGMTYGGRYFRCWQREGHGSVDLLGAIQHSCNVYFYQLGLRLGLQTLAREGSRFGFGRRTGIDLPTESRGTFPRDTTWWRKEYGRPPVASEVLNLAIGQGPNAQTPLRVAQFFAALATDGTVPTPHMVVGAGSRSPETDLRVSAATLSAVRDGMGRVTAPGGTAAKVALGRWKLAGKTGTAQNEQDKRRPHAWFAGFAGPHDGTPEIALTVLVEHGESGSDAAAPIASRIAGFYLARKHAKR